jgi:hypothetical protein
MKVKTIVKRGLVIICLLLICVFVSYYYDTSVAVASASTELDFPVEVKREENIRRTLYANILISQSQYSRQKVLRIVKWYLKTREPKDWVRIQVFTNSKAAELIDIPDDVCDGFAIPRLIDGLKKAYNTPYDAEWKMDSESTTGLLTRRVFLTIPMVWRTDYPVLIK